MNCRTSVWLPPVSRTARRRQKLRRAARKSAAAGGAVTDAREKLRATQPVADTAAAGLLGVTSEAFADELADYVDANPDGLLNEKVGPAGAHLGSALALAFVDTVGAAQIHY